MKKIITIFIALLCVACQTITDSERLIDMPPVSVLTKDKPHLLVDFSAFRCVNCPLANEEAHRLQTLYKEALVVVEMHAPMCPLTQGAYDYTCPEADTYFEYLGGAVTSPLPTGNIDFLAKDEEYLIDRSLWATQMTERIKDTASMTLALNVSYDASSRDVTIKTNISDYTGTGNCDYSVLLWLVEDSIIGPQLMPDNSTDMNYVHNHVLRHAINGAWGARQTLPVQPAYETAYQLPEDYDPQHSYIVAVIIDSQTKAVYTVDKSDYLQGETVLVEVTGYGEIPAEGLTLTLSEPESDPLTGQKRFSLDGLVELSGGELLVTISRSEAGLNDEFCCGSVCTAGNKEISETRTFAVKDGYALWYLHYTPEPNSEVTCTYTFTAGSASTTLIVNYLNK